MYATWLRNTSVREIGTTTPAEPMTCYREAPIEGSDRRPNAVSKAAPIKPDVSEASRMPIFT